VFRPNPGPQSDFLSATETEVLYGGPLAYDTKVVTPSGYKTMGEIAVGDYVATPSGKFSKVVEIPFEGHEKSYLVEFEDGTSIVASKGHKWQVGTSDWAKTGNPFRTKITEELLDFSLPRNRSKYFVKVSSPVEFEKVNTLLDPYFIGALLGDGCVTKRGNFTLTGIDEEIPERINTTLPEGFSIKKVKGGIQWKFTHGRFGTYKEKEVVWKEHFHILVCRA